MRLFLCAYTFQRKIYWKNSVTFRSSLTLIWVGFYGVRFETEGGGLKLPSGLKLVRIML